MGFWTRTNGSSLTERVRILSTGHMDFKGSYDILNVGDGSNHWTTGYLQVGNGHIWMSAGGATRGIKIASDSVALDENLLSADDAHIFVKGDLFCIAFKDSDNDTRYLTVNLGSGGSATWNFSTDAPA